MVKVFDTILQRKNNNVYVFLNETCIFCISWIFFKQNNVLIIILKSFEFDLEILKQGKLDWNNYICTWQYNKCKSLNIYFKVLFIKLKVREYYIKVKEPRSVAYTRLILHSTHVLG